jgi:hypothetical protein
MVLEIQEMSEFFFLCAEVMSGRLGGLDLDRDSLNNS